MSVCGCRLNPSYPRIHRHLLLLLILCIPSRYFLRAEVDACGDVEKGLGRVIVKIKLQEVEPADMGKVRRATLEFIRATYTAGFTLEELEQEFRFLVVTHHLEHHYGNQSRTARALGIHRNTLRKILSQMRELNREIPVHQRPANWQPVTTRERQ